MTASKAPTDLAPGVRVLIADIGIGRVDRVSGDGLWWFVTLNVAVDEWRDGVHVRRHGGGVCNVFTLAPALDDRPLHFFSIYAGHA